MSKKKLQVTNLVNELHGASAFFRSQPKPKLTTLKKVPSLIQKPTSNSTRERETSSDNPRETSRGNLRDLPTRDEVQEFSFRLRDEIKTKVQAEVPHHWQKELEDIASVSP